MLNQIDEAEDISGLVREYQFRTHRGHEWESLALSSCELSRRSSHSRPHYFSLNIIRTAAHHSPASVLDDSRFRMTIKSTPTPGLEFCEQVRVLGIAVPPARKAQRG